MCVSPDKSGPQGKRVSAMSAAACQAGSRAGRGHVAKYYRRHANLLPATGDLKRGGLLRVDCAILTV